MGRNVHVKARPEKQEAIENLLDIVNRPYDSVGHVLGCVLLFAKTLARSASAFVCVA